MNNRNRLWNVTNPYQGDYKRVLCVCSAGLLRSPTAAWVLSHGPWNYNTRAAGLDVDHALVPVDDVLLAWAHEIVCMSKEQEIRLRAMTTLELNIMCLDIEDRYGYREPELVKQIREKYTALNGVNSAQEIEKDCVRK